MKAALPDKALLRDYVERGAYTDCFTLGIADSVTHAQYVEAFYTTPLFRLERMLLSWLAGRPSRDADVRAMASGASDRFAAWSVEARADNQLLLCDFQGRTRSWLMSVPGEGGTQLYFGSAVVPLRGGGMGGAFKALLGFHKLYSRLLLRAAARRVTRR